MGIELYAALRNSGKNLSIVWRGKIFIRIVSWYYSAFEIAFLVVSSCEFGWVLLFKGFSNIFKIQKKSLMGKWNKKVAGKEQ